MEDQPAPERKRINLRKDGEIDDRGHGKGSRATRFKAGDGRRRPGRSKGSRSEKSDVLMVRDMTVSVTMGRRTSKATTRLAMLLAMRAKALKGDHKAIEWLDRKFGQYEPPEVDVGQTERLLVEDEAILLDDARARGLIGDQREKDEQ